MSLNSILGNKKIKRIYSGKFYNSKEEAEYFKRNGERIFFDPFTRKYYLKSSFSPRW